MKNYISIFFIVFLNASIISQTMLERLDSPDYSVRVDALIEIRDNNLVEYINDLVERTFEQPRLYLTDFFVDVLFILEYGDIGGIIYQFIDVCDNFPQENPLGYKVQATELLFQLDDHSTVEYVFEYVSLDPLKNGEEFISLLKEIALNIPQYSQTVKDLLINIKNNSEFYSKRKEALENLILIFGENSLQTEILSSIINDSNADIRNLAMGHYNFTDRKDLLRQQIENDSDWYRRLNYSEIYLKSYFEPEDLKFIKDYSLIEPNEVAGRSIANLSDGFIPPKPDTLNWNGLTTRLISYTYDLLQYDWIASEIIRAFYQTKLNDVIQAVQAGKYGKACAIINNTLLPTIEQHLGNNNITIEGYKFLHYYTIYIKEEIEGQFGACP